MKSKLTLTSLLWVLVATIGCSSNPQTGKVSGKVTIDGQPMTFGRVQFSPVAVEGQLEVGKSGFGYIQTDGSFQLTTYSEGDGAVVGKHRVFIINSSNDDQAKTASKNSSFAAFDLLRIPNLRVDVSAGENKIDIPITTEMIRQFAESD